MAIPKSARTKSRPHLDPEPKSVPRTGAKKTVMNYVAELPRFLTLLWGLLRDARVNVVDKVLVAGAIAYIVAPMDWIPDFIPFLGEVDDLYLLLLALQRLMQNAGRTVLLSHWTGDPADGAPIYAPFRRMTVFTVSKMMNRSRAIDRFLM